MFSQTAEYALRAVVCLAADPDEPQTTQQIAASTKVPAGYLSKVLQALGRAGLVRSQRGLHGGFSLVRHPIDVSVLDVINAVDPLERIHDCPIGITHLGGKLCSLHRRLDEGIAHLQGVFGGTSIEELVVEAPERRPLCDVSRVEGASGPGSSESDTTEPGASA